VRPRKGRSCACALTQAVLPTPLQFEAACAHVVGTRQPLAQLESLLDAAALTKARAARGRPHLHAA
jgi:hypothetical protein